MHKELSMHPKWLCFSGDNDTWRGLFLSSRDLWIAPMFGLAKLSEEEKRLCMTLPSLHLCVVPQTGLSITRMRVWLGVALLRVTFWLFKRIPLEQRISLVQEIPSNEKG